MEFRNGMSFKKGHLWVRMFNHIFILFKDIRLHPLLYSQRIPTKRTIKFTVLFYYFEIGIY